MQIPTHIHVDPATGRIYVSDPQCRAVYMFTHTGDYVGAFDWTFFKSTTGYFNPIPRGLAQGPDGLIYVVEHKSRRVIAFDKDGTFVRAFPRQSDMNDPRGLDIDQNTGEVVVVAAYFNAIFRFAQDGTFLSKWTTVDGAAGNGAKFDSIRFPAVDGDGNIYVGETWGSRQPDGSYRGYGIYKFSRDGVRLPWASPAAGPPDGGFNQQNGIALDSAGRLHVVDTFEQRVQRFDTTSSCPSNASCPAWQLQYGSRELRLACSPRASATRGR